MIPNGEMMLAKQCEEQFPAGWEDRESEREALDSVELQKILTVLDEISEFECQVVHHVDDGIQDILRARNGKKQDAELKELDQAVLHADKDNFETAFNQLRNYLEKNGIVQNDAFRFDALKALYQFRNYLELQTKESMKYSFHFNENLLINALKLYDDNYRRFGDRWDSAKNLVSWRKIIGYTQRFVPACLAQTIHQGVYYIVQDRETLRRQTHFKYDSAFKLLPVDPLSPSLPGYDFAAVAGAWSGFDAARAGYRPCLAFTKLMSSKNINVAKLTQQPGSQSKKIPAMK